MEMIVLFAQVSGTLQGGAKVQTPVSTLQSITVSPSLTTVIVGTSVLFTANGIFSGSTSDITSSCAWTSSNTAVATIGPTSNPQVVNTASAGTANITCSMQGITGTGQVIVTTITASPSVVPAGVDGQAYSVGFTGSGGTAPYTFSITNGLTGLQAIGLNFTSPTLSGTLSATSVGTHAFTLQITDSTTPTPRTASQGYVLIVNSSTGPSRVAVLPQVWADPHESDLPNPCDVAHNCFVKHIRADGTGDYACSVAGLNAMTVAWAATAPNVWWHVLIDDGLSYAGQCHITSSALTGWLWRAKSTGYPTAFLVVESEHPNPRGRTVCNHMTVISLTADLRNPSCDTTPGFDDLAHMWKFTLTGSGGGYGGGFINLYNQTDGAGNGPNHIVVRDVEVEAIQKGQSAIILFYTCNMNAGVSSCPVQPPTAASFGSHIGVEYSYLHGDLYAPATGYIASPSGSSTNVFVYIACTLCWFSWNYADRFAGSSNGISGEGKGISMTNAGPGVKISHNYMEGTEIGFLSGGASGTNRNSPSSDEEIRANVWTRDPAWMTSRSLGMGSGPTGWADCRFPMKNPFEIKEGKRYLINGNVFEVSYGCGQQGQTGTFTVRACSGSNCNNFTAEISDITFTNNISRNAVNAIQTSARSFGAGNGGMVSLPVRRMNFANNLAYNLRNPANVYQQTADMEINWNTCTGSRDAAGAVATITCGQSNNPPWNSRTLVAVGDPIAFRNCTPASFNTPVGPGPSALPGTDGLQPNGRTVVYANAGPPNEQVVSGCVLWTAQGAPFETTYTHNTNVWNSGGVNFPTMTGIGATNCVYARGNTFLDDILAANATATWYLFRACGSTGIAGQALGWDTGTLIFHHMLFLGNKASQANPYPASQAGTLWSPPQTGIVCAGATADSSCIGFNGYMNGAAFINDPVTIGQDPLVFYALHSSSLYRAGGSRAASDGTDMGADMDKIRNALTETLYSGCSAATGNCGTGPHPD